MISTLRVITALGIPFLIAYAGYKKKSLCLSGAISGFCIGFVMTLSSYTFLGVLFTFFVSSSKATKINPHLKRKFEQDFKDGGERNWAQVFSNGFGCCLFSLLHLYICGCGELPVDFIHSYSCSWFAIAVLGSLSCCNGDTWASELGSVLSKSQPFLITTMKTVPRGTNGGVSVMGLVMSFFGGLLVGFAFYVIQVLCLYYTTEGVVLSQFPVVPLGAIGGFLGSAIDSLLGASLQFSGIEKSGCIVESPGPNVKHISGYPLLNNHLVNLISSLFTAVILPYLALPFI